MDNLQPGQNLGSYRIINQIGQGGMATVYKAYQAAMDRYVALKILPSQLKESKEFAGRFQQEARVIAHLEHPHILPVFDYGESDGISYLVMRYLEAGTLKDKMSAGPLSLQEIDRIFTQLTDALGYAHSRGVVHRDLKPANVLIDSLGNVFLTDFGIAKLLEGSSHFTQTDAVIGTPAYISPEQAQAQPVDQRSDIYSLGIILYEMVAGRVPFTADTPLAILFKHVSDPLPLPSSIKLDVPHAIENVILKALSKNPADRFQTAAEFSAAWKRALSESNTLPQRSASAAGIAPTPSYSAAEVASTPTVISSAPAAPATTTSTLSRRNPAVWVLGCVMTLCLLAVVGGVAYAGFNWKNLPAFFSASTKTPEATQTSSGAEPTRPASPTEPGSINVQPTLNIDSLTGDKFTVALGDEISQDKPGTGAGFIDKPGAKDIYTFTAQAGQVIYLQVSRPPKTGDLINLQLLDDFGSQLISTCLQCSDPGVITFERAGTYTLIIGNDRPDGAGTGSYGIKLWVVPPPDQFDLKVGDEISNGVPGPGAGNIESLGAKDIYTFTATAGQSVYFQTIAPPNNNELMNWKLTDANGSDLFATCLQCGDPGVITLEVGGTYTLTVGNDKGPAAGTYDIKLWNVPAPDTFAIKIGDSISNGVPGKGAGFIETPGVKDVYTFTGKAGQTLTFTVTQPPKSNDLITWKLVDEFGNDLFNTCLQCGSPQPVTLDRDGTYKLIVGNDKGAATGSYGVTITAQ